MQITQLGQIHLFLGAYDEANPFARKEVLSFDHSLSVNRDVVVAVGNRGLIIAPPDVNADNDIAIQRVNKGPADI